MISVHCVKTGFLARPEEASDKARAKLKEALARAMHAWHHGMDPAFPGIGQGMLQYHFTPQAFYRYKGIYQARGAKYEKRKQNKYGHKNPLVWTGLTRDSVKGGISVSGSFREVRGRMSGANRALNFGGRSNMPDMRKELMAVNKDEDQVLSEGTAKIWAEYLNEAKELFESGQRDVAALAHAAHEAQYEH
jgi:hypothetical protein